MKPLTREWVEKGEADWNTARRELRVRKSPNFDAVCFHAQQSFPPKPMGRLTRFYSPGNAGGKRLLHPNIGQMSSARSLADAVIRPIAIH